MVWTAIPWVAAALWLQGAAEFVQPGRIEGRVVDALSAEPLARARLYLSRAGGREASYGAASDADGRFAFENVQPGAYTLSAEKVGYLRQGAATRGPGSAAQIVKLAAGQELTGLLVKLMPQAVVSGRILDEEGEPLPHIGVTVLRQGYGENGRRLVPVGYAEANDLGEYRVAQLPPGRYYVLAYFRGWMPIRVLGAPGGRAQALAPTFYPSAPEEASATPVELAAGQEVGGFDIRMRRTFLYRVSGRLVAAGVPPAARGRVIVLMPRGRWSASGLDLVSKSAVAEQENFEIRDVPPGSYLLTVASGERSGAPLARQPVEVTNGDVEGLIVTLSPPVEVRGVVRLEGAAKVDLRGVRVSLSVPGLRFAQVRGQAQGDGSFRLGPVVRDSYEVLVSNLPEGTYLKAIRLAGQDVLGRAADLVPGAQLEIVLAAGAAQIEGLVETEAGEAATACTVTLVPDPPQPARPDLYKNATCEDGGRFRLTSVSPGAYKLYAWESLEPWAERDPDFLRQYQSQAASVQLSAGGREQLRLRRIASAPR